MHFTKNEQPTFPQSNLTLVMQQQQFHRKITVFLPANLPCDLMENMLVEIAERPLLVLLHQPLILSTKLSAKIQNKQNRNEISVQIIILSKFGECCNATYRFDLTSSTFDKIMLTNFVQS